MQYARPNRRYRTVPPGLVHSATRCQVTVALGLCTADPPRHTEALTCVPAIVCINLGFNVPYTAMNNAYPAQACQMDTVLFGNHSNGAFFTKCKAPESLRSGSGSVQNSKFSGMWSLSVVGMRVWAEPEARGQLSWTKDKHSHQGFQTLCHVTEAGRVDSMSLSSRTTVSQTCARSNFPGEVLCTINSTSM